MRNKNQLLKWSAVLIFMYKFCIASTLRIHNKSNQKIIAIHYPYHSIKSDLLSRLTTFKIGYTRTYTLCKMIDTLRAYFTMLVDMSAAQQNRWL